MDVLIRQNGHALGKRIVGVLDFAAALSQFGKIGVTQNGEKPRFEVRTFFEALKIGPGFNKRILHKIVSARWIAA
jgi:hypothetical protein